MSLGVGNDLCSRREGYKANMCCAVELLWNIALNDLFKISLNLLTCVLSFSFPGDKAGKKGTIWVC